MSRASRRNPDHTGRVRRPRTLVWSILPNGSYLPLSDTHVEQGPSRRLVQLGMHRYPELFRGALATLKATLALYEDPWRSVTYALHAHSGGAPEGPLPETPPR